MEKILVVDDQKGMRDFLSILLHQEGYAVETAKGGETALRCLKEEIFDLVLTDIKMPGMGGLALLKAIKEISPETAVVMMTAFASTETAIEAMKEGAFDYLAKPFQVEEVKLRIKHVLERKKLYWENARLTSELKGRAAFAEIIGQSDKMKSVLSLVQKVADSRSNVLIYGESGTGKELIARAIHFNSIRGEKPFVSVNCSALPEGLLESELFGHMKGAFTGAVEHKDGLFEVANTGSIFLDEIAETPWAIQVKLLRVLQEKEFRRVGGTKNIQVDVRIIAATNKNLEKWVSEGKFREDLYYRLDVIPIVLPPLRERPEDIPPLVEFFIHRFNQKLGRQIEGIRDEAMRLLIRHEWKGNIRELENMMERAVVLASTPWLDIEDFGDILQKTAPLATVPVILPKGGLHFEGLIEKIEKDLLIKALDESHWVKKEAARLLHMSFRSFRYRLAKYGVRKRNLEDVEMGPVPLDGSPRGEEGRGEHNSK